MTVEELLEEMRVFTETLIFLPWPSPLGSDVKARVKYDICIHKWDVTVISLGGCLSQRRFSGSLIDCLKFVMDACNLEVRR